MKLYTADKETGTFIEEIKSIEEGAAMILLYEKDDIANGNYVDDFYDIVNENHESVL